MSSSIVPIILACGTPLSSIPKHSSLYAIVMDVLNEPRVYRLLSWELGELPPEDFLNKRICIRSRNRGEFGSSHYKSGLWLSPIERVYSNPEAALRDLIRQHRDRINDLKKMIPHSEPPKYSRDFPSTPLPKPDFSLDCSEIEPLILCQFLESRSYRELTDPPSPSVHVFLHKHDEGQLTRGFNLIFPRSRLDPLYNQLVRSIINHFCKSADECVSTTMTLIEQSRHLRKPYYNHSGNQNQPTPQ
jgi:hypothetical protein